MIQKSDMKFGKLDYIGNKVDKSKKIDYNMEKFERHEHVQGGSGMRDLPDAADIRLAERTGYGPTFGPRVECPCCGGALTAGDAMYEWAEGRKSGWLCADCFDERFDAMTRNERARRIGLAYKRI